MLLVDIKNGEVKEEPIRKPGFDTLRKFLRYKNSNLNDNSQYLKANNGNKSNFVSHKKQLSYHNQS